MTSSEPKPGKGADELERDRIAAELEALGEEPFGDDELAFVSSETPDVDISTVETLARWAEPDAPSEELSELAQARVWRTIELRTKSAASAPTNPVDAATSKGSRPLLLGTVVALLAVAAAVVLVPMLAPPKPAETQAPVATVVAPSLSSEELDVLSAQARASLMALDRLSGEPRGGARATAMADAYARRLEVEGLEVEGLEVEG